MISEDTTKTQGIMILAGVVLLFTIFGLYVKGFIAEEKELRGNLSMEDRIRFVCSTEENPNFTPKWLNLRCAMWEIFKD